MQSNPSSSITIFHNPACGTSRNTLALIRDSGVEPEVVQYLKTPLAKEQLRALVEAMGVPVRDILRAEGNALRRAGSRRPEVERRAAARLHRRSTRS